MLYFPKVSEASLGALRFVKGAELEKIPDLVRAYLTPHIPAPFALVDVEWERLGPDEILRVLVDKPGGIALADTEELSRLISPLLDELRPDPFPAEGYLLE